ncbi:MULTISPECIES: phage tail protein [Alteromonadaceae]|uniref:phage tail protein n=1 Tax=Alteromonadaceae TaxID=72275 RepID=UPI001C0809AD|nr:MULTISPECIES: phage tail protein [Aliiglaciecola]MBU2876702.1 phage tail protein [Aliiglaciecola lipolytica]MDO6710294.1 phage tail protein [Aliiglaciecola sp. 2_MG-2023]MDO6751442.1 phage tail protein [Aliiglaciecola sp. 1_MG-2023]
MATFREDPYSAFNFLVSLNDGQESELVGGFSDVSGLGVEVSYAEYRNGNEKVNTVRKIANTFKVDDVTLKRGLIGSTSLWEWLSNVSAGAHEPRLVVITLLDEAREAVASWELRKAQPKKWTGPSLAAKGGGEVAMEELSLVCEGCKYS